MRPRPEPKPGSGLLSDREPPTRPSKAFFTEAEVRMPVTMYVNAALGQTGHECMAAGSYCLHCDNGEHKTIQDQACVHTMLVCAHMEKLVQHNPCPQGTSNPIKEQIIQQIIIAQS